MHYPNPITNNGTVGGTIGGTVLVIFNLHAADILKTGLLAGIGAIVSFLVSFALTALTQRVKQRWRR